VRLIKKVNRFESEHEAVEELAIATVKADATVEDIMEQIRDDS
jgi:hypothetical protein